MNITKIGLQLTKLSAGVGSDFKNKIFQASLCLLAVFGFLYATQAITAQSPDEVWSFEYYESFPHENWGCPYYCYQLQPKTKIAYASNYYYFTDDRIVNNLDRNLFATFNGGIMMGGNYETSLCRYGMWGYGTFKTAGSTESCENSSGEIDVSFSQPVRSSSISLRGKYPQRLIVTESGQAPVFVDLGPDYDMQGQINEKGIATLSLSGRKITGLTVKSADADYAFSVDSVNVKKTAPSTPNPGGAAPNYCPAPTFQRPAPQNHAGYGWTMRSEVSDADGLVLSDVRLNGRLMAERISVPYYQITTNQTPSQRGELRPNDGGGTLRSRLVSYKPDANDERLIISATYAIDNLSASQSCLSITQRYEFLKSESGGVCAPDYTHGHLASDCNRWRALVTYDFKGNNGETLQSLNAAQRNHFRVNGAAKNSVGLFRDCDNAPPPFNTGCLPYEGGLFKRKLNPLFSEHYSVVAANGQQTGSWDNLHQTYRNYVTEPLSPETFLSKYVLGGCPECIHSHWRWGRHFGEAFGNGNLRLPAGSDQNLSFGVVRYRAGEEHPSNLFDLISFTNPEPIRSRLTGMNIPDRDHYNYTVPEEVVHWLSATGHKTSDEFFSYYSFFNTDEPNSTRSISSCSNLLKPAAPHTSHSAQHAPPEKKSLSSTDAPTSIIYGHLYEDGTTTYTERDPNSIAQLPNGYAHYNNVSYDVRAEAEVSGPHTVTFNLPSVADQATFDSLRVLHSEPDPLNPARTVWVDRTILSPNSPAPNFASRNISAKVYEVGPFVIVRLVSTPPANTNTADLSVTIGESIDPITAGNNLIYTVNVTNNGPHTATGIGLNSGLSPDVEFISAVAGQGSCQEINGTVICELDTIASGVTVPVAVTVKVNEGVTRFPPEGKSITNITFVRANEIDSNENNNAATASTNALPNPNAPPTVQIQNPAAGAILAGPATFSVIIGATDGDGAIAQVELFEDGESVGSGTLVETGKYAVTRTGAAFGEHSLVAVATDDGGRKAVSNSVNYFVNGPAIVSLDSPAENSVFGRPANIVLSATAANESGTISQVEFLANGESLGNGALSGTNLYNLTWNNAPTGAISLRAVATDGGGVKSYSLPTNIIVTNAPIVSIVNPVSSASYAKPANIGFTVNSRDFDGYVAKVEFFAGGNSLGTGTLTQNEIFTFIWTNAPVGTHGVTAVATDNSGKTSVSSPVNVTVTNLAPTVSMTSPVSGASFIAPANILLSANAADGDGEIRKVEFFRGTTFIGRSSFAPFNFEWKNVVVGSYSLTARATDDDGAMSVSSPVTITVNPVGNALLVVGSATLSSVDNAIKTRLQNLGLNVVIKTATAAVSADATGKRVVVISDSVTPTNVNTKFRAVVVPVVTLDVQLFDDMGMCAAATTNFGTTATQKDVTITDAAHPMAAGLSDTIQATSANTTFGWGKPNANAVKIATLTTDATKATSFGYEANAAMPGLTAPRRRVGFFYTASSSSLTTNGGLLFDNAIKWVAGL